MALLYGQNYAYIDLATGMCIGFTSGTATWEDGQQPENVISVPVNDPEYICKYYNRADGNWYEDAEFTIPWQSSLI